jgi:predicted ATPase
MKTDVLEVNQKMGEIKVFLEKIYITNFLSLHDVELPFKALTILVGPNASGKSNVLKIFDILSKMMTRENLPSVDDIQSWLWAGGADKLGLYLVARADHKLASYKLELQPESENRIASEELIVDEVEVISVRNGSGKITDEDGKNSIDFRSKKLALKSAGDYGDKPITKALAEFIHDLELYDLEPDEIRKGKVTASAMRKLDAKGLPTRMNKDGRALGLLLYDWAEKDHNRFQAVSEGLNNCCKLSIGQQGDELYLLEGYKNLIPLEMASDGTLRLLAYLGLLVEPESPPLIMIEEPERNLHPAALTQLGSLLKRLSKKTQVIITTHSSQLLDTFSPDDLSGDLMVLLLGNEPGIGTEVMNVEEMRAKQKSLRGWITDFGIGSAIFDSGLIENELEN